MEGEKMGDDGAPIRYPSLRFSRTWTGMTENKIRTWRGSNFRSSNTVDLWTTSERREDLRDRFTSRPDEEELGRRPTHSWSAVESRSDCSCGDLLPRSGECEVGMPVVRIPGAMSLGVEGCCLWQERRQRSLRGSANR